jgi:hypothetical protein
MAKDGKRKKVKSRSSTKYETTSDEDNCSDEEDNLRTLFANLNMQQKEKLNELISAIHAKDILLDSQEDFLIKENKTHVKVKNIMTTDRPLELLHMDLFGPIAYISIDRSKYCLVIVDDYSRFTWVFFLQEKSHTQETLKGFLR